MSANPTQKHLSRASNEHLRAARAALTVSATPGNRSGARTALKSTGASGASPRSAAYLAHVATECAIKLRMLKLHNRARTEEMRKVLKENDFDLLFRSKHGHDLRRLSEHASLKRLLTAENSQALLENKAWKRMTSEDRPFDLRYGTASASHEEAKAEVDLASAIVIAIQREIGG